MSYYPAERDLSAFECEDEDGSNRRCSTMEPADDSLIQFDNGTHCLGARKNDPPFTRIVEYDLSSGTEARFVREYRLPAADRLRGNHAARPPDC